MKFVNKLAVVFSLCSCLVLLIGFSVSASSQNSFEVIGNTINDEEKKISEDFQPIRDTVEDTIVSEFGTDFLHNNVSVTMEYKGKKSRIVINYKENDKHFKKIKKLIQKSVPEQKIKFNKIDYTPEELHKFTKEMIDYMKSNNTVRNKLAGIDPDADKSVIYVLYKEKLSNIEKSNFKSIFKKTKFVKTKKNSGFKEEISRSKNYNKLGGGIRIDDGGGCTANSVARKDTRWFLITAGHCLEADGGYTLQNNLIVGTDHAQLDGRDIDAGVVLLDSTSSITRY
ncbi:hypothetical protein [Salimicrobium flavidum]|uniref:Trypsin n=1 Tax=Salimicrobium flavidum TaxID=570947 RepID=A0A1N7KCZ5_9BACI|nr:hypothetical protein [Salimicrobium flavidum]SIS59486.1 hypothetical protein SAMN05421687_11060 [Salimicrobium flavidum]